MIFSNIWNARPELFFALARESIKGRRRADFKSDRDRYS